MALIKCPECQREVSDKAQNCPHCGYPMREEKTAEQKENPKPEKPKKKLDKMYIAIIIALVFVVGIPITLSLCFPSHYDEELTEYAQNEKESSIVGKYRLGREGDNDYILTLNEDGTANWYFPLSGSGYTFYGFWKDESGLNDDEKAIRVKIDTGGYKFRVNEENSLHRILIDDFLICDNYAYQNSDKRKARDPNYRVSYRKIEEEPTMTINPSKEGLHKPDSIEVIPSETQTRSQLAVNGEDYYYIEDNEGNSYIIILFHDKNKTLYLWDEFCNYIAKGKWNEMKQPHGDICIIIDLNTQLEEAKIKGSKNYTSIIQAYLGQDGYMYLDRPRGKGENRIKYEKRDYLPE